MYYTIVKKVNEFIKKNTSLKYTIKNKNERLKAIFFFGI